MRVSLLSGVLLILFSAGLGAAQDEIIVEAVSSELVEGNYYVDARVNFNLDDDLREALDHGVELDVRIIIRVREQRRWLRDRIYREAKIKYKLDYLPLSDAYIVTTVRKSEQRQFDTLANALKYMGKLDRYRLLDAGETSGGPRLRAALKGVINVKDLPPPMKPVAFLVNKWQSESGWHKWVIEQ